jgi:hypothetical protein
VNQESRRVVRGDEEDRRDVGRFLLLEIQRGESLTLGRQHAPARPVAEVDRRIVRDDGGDAIALAHEWLLGRRIAVV